jgi:hypothetical protein
MEINKEFSFHYFENIIFIKRILEELNIPCLPNVAHDGAQLRFPWCEGDVVCHCGSYGNKQGLVETYQFPWDNGDVSVMPPQEACRRIVGYYQDFLKETIDNID